MSLSDTELLQIRHHAGEYDRSGDWPQADLDALAAAGAMRWAIPREFGGDELSSLELHLRYEKLAAASLSLALIFTQRDSAIGLLDGADNKSLREDLLTKLSRDEIFATIGIAQLTTSRQGGAPVLVAKRVENTWKIDGLIPWSTGADQSEFVIGGAALADKSGQQILFALPTKLTGVVITPPLPLVSLRSSHTASIACINVRLEDRFIIRGPVANALAGRKKTVPLGQAFLALGLCRGGIDLIGEHDSELARRTVAEYELQLSRLRTQVLQQCDPDIAPDPAVIPQLRGACNDLALRITHSAVAIYKGSALLADHPAQRLAREALFLLVWSCPNPVIDCTVQMLSGTAARL